MIHPINSNCDVLFVGAGPVGLICAIQAKLQDPSLNIALVERFQEYVRTQNLSIHSSSLSQICDLHQVKYLHPEYAEQVDEFAQLIFDLKSQGQMKINRLETRLRQIAERLNIATHRGYTFLANPVERPAQTEINGVEALRRAFPRAKVIVGSDGAHSKVREAVFRNEMKVNETLQYTIAVKYWVKNRTEELDSFTAYPTEKVTGTTEEHIGRYDEDRQATPVTLQCFVDKETFERFEHYRAGNPLSLDALRELDPALDQKIRTWLGVRREYLEDSIEGDIQVYTIKLPAYASKKAVLVAGGTTFCLLGDALIGVPFYQSINIGLLCASKLSKIIVKTLNPRALPKNRSFLQLIQAFVKKIFAYIGLYELKLPFERFARFADQIGDQAIQTARFKNFFLDSYQWFVATTASSPWQITRWQEDEIRQLSQLNLN